MILEKAKGHGRRAIIITDCFCNMSAMVCSYCSPSNAIFLRCSSFSLRMMVFCSSLEVVCKTCVFKALYWRVCILQVSRNCFRIMSSFCLRLFGCCFSSKACFFFSSRWARFMYSSWLLSSVECCRLMWSSRKWWTDFCCLDSSSWVSSWWRINIACADSNCDCRLFNSYRKQ